MLAVAVGAKYLLGVLTIVFALAAFVVIVFLQAVA